VCVGLAVAKQAKQVKLTKAAKQWRQALESRAWRSWQSAAAEAKSWRKIAARWMQPAKVIPNFKCCCSCENKGSYLCTVLRDCLNA
jgi:hypothetical protein